MRHRVEPVEIDGFLPGFKYEACCGDATVEDLVGASKEMRLLYFNISLNMRAGENKYEVVVLGSKRPEDGPLIKYSNELDPEKDDVLRRLLSWKMPQDWKEYWSSPLNMLSHGPGVEALTDYMMGIKDAILESIPYGRVSIGPNPSFLNPSSPHSLR